jgi:membrane fusion protein (multidrug efflux system)
MSTTDNSSGAADSASPPTGETRPANAAAAPRAATAGPGAAPPPNAPRKRALTAVALLVALAGIAYGVYWALVLNHFETTDNAYVQGNVVQITPQVGGTVIAINAADTDRVKAGEWLVKLDPADAQVALDQAEAQLAQTVREVRTLFANNSTLRAQIALRKADLARAQSELVRAEDDVARRAPLLASGAVGNEEFSHVRAQLAAVKSSVAAAQSAVQAAREQLAANQTLTNGVAIDTHPNVRLAAARVRAAYLALHRAVLLAPIDGYVAKRSVQLGARVAAGTPLMSVVPLEDVWVEANFKESQLENLRIGQTVELTADVYGSEVEYHGKVEGLGAGTGAAFALLPAQNATGNWIKVVQRVPVRIALDGKQLAEHPLRVGLSMDVRVDVKNTGGKMLADAAHPANPTRTTVFDHNEGAAQAEVQRIIAANSGPRASLAPRPAKAARRFANANAPRVSTLAASGTTATTATVRLK